MLVNAHKLKYLLFAFLSIAWNGARAQVISLEQALDTALKNNRSLLISKNQVQLSREKEDEARSAKRPKLNANVDYRYFIELPYQLMPMSVFGGQEGQFKEAQFGVPHNINANLQLTMPLYNPQLTGAIEATRIGQEISGHQHRKAEEQVYLEISNLYYNAQIILNQLAFIDSNLENSKEMLGIMRILQEQLMAKGTDVDKMRLQVDQLSTQKEQLSSQYRQVLNGLKLAMGLPVEKEVDVEKDINYQPGQENNDLHSTPDIDLTISKGKLLQTELQTLKNSRLPVVSFIASYGTAGLGYDKKPNEFLKFYPTGFAGVQLSVPIFNGNNTKIKMSQKNIEIRNNELQKDLLEDQVLVQVINARQQRAVAMQSIETTLSQTKLAQDIYEQTVLQQKEGIATINDVLLADNSLRDAQQKYLSAIVEYLKADLELKKSTGNILKN